MRLRRAAAGLACACLAQAVQLAFLSRAVAQPASPAFFFSHILVLVAWNVAVALTLGGVRGDRSWAAVVFVVPQGLALWPIALLYAGAWGVCALVLLAFVAVGAWSFLPLGRGAPLVAALLGAVSAAETVLVRVDSFRGFRATDPSALAVAAVTAIVTAASTLLAGRWKALGMPRLRVSLAAALGGLLAGGLVGLDDAPSVPHPSSDSHASGDLPPVVLIVLDTVRADHLKAYGYWRDTMPRLERFGREDAVRVERSVANSSWTIPTHASYFTGLYPPRHGAGTGPLPPEPSHVYALGAGLPTLAELLRAKGYWTTAVASNFGVFLPAFGLDRGFQRIASLPSADYAMRIRTPWSGVSRMVAPFAALDAARPFSDCEFFEHGVPFWRATATTHEALRAIDDTGERPFFLFVNYLDAHAPYDPPPPYRDAFPGRRAVDELGGWGWLSRASEGVLSGGRDLTAAEREHLTALYDGALAYLDHDLDRLVARLRRHPRWSEMLVVVTSDHGECLGEHRLLYHEKELYDELLRVPLFVKPGRVRPEGWSPGATLPGPFQSVDVFPTILESAGIAPPPGLDGSPWGRGRAAALAWVSPRETARQYPHRFAEDLRSIESDGWKLIEGRGGRTELFDLARDPGETRNLAAERRDQADRLRGLLGPWPAAVARPVALDEVTRERVRSIGYVQ